MSDQLIGLLLFAQRIEECLFDYSLDSYKAPTLNTHTRCVELVRTIEQVQAGIINPKSIKPIVEELCLSINADLAVETLIGNLAKQLKTPTWWSTENLINLKIQADLLRSRLWQRTYEREIRSHLLKLVPEGKRKKDILLLATNLATEWMAVGFSREYIYYITRTHFFGLRAKIEDPLVALTKFFSFFDLPEKEYEVCLRASSNLQALQAGLPPDQVKVESTAPSARSMSTQEKLFLQKPFDGVFLTISKVRARDPKSARDLALRRLENLSTLAYYHSHLISLSWDSEILVWEGDRAIVLKNSKSPIHKADECSISDLPKRLQSTVLSFVPRRPEMQESWMRIRAAFGIAQIGDRVGRKCHDSLSKSPPLSPKFPSARR